MYTSSGTTKAELIDIVDPLPLEFAVAAQISEQLRRIERGSYVQGTSKHRTRDERRRYALRLVQEHMGL